VLDILKEMHPPAGDIHVSSLLNIQDTDNLPILVDTDITSSHVEKAARSIRGGAGPGGTNSTQWQDFLLYHGAHSEKLRDQVAALARRLCNSIVEWTDIRALLSNRLIALDKRPGVRPIGIGECLRRILGKCMALATGSDVEVVCGSQQLCCGIPAG
jgi:hypothetical protein